MRNAIMEMPRSQPELPRQANLHRALFQAAFTLTELSRPNSPMGWRCEFTHRRNAQGVLKLAHHQLSNPAARAGSNIGEKP
jgi:hypothetical protein